MSFKLEIKISPQARVQIELAAEWCSENQPAAPDAVRRDLAEILEVLSAHPGIGTPARHSRIKGLRRIIPSPSSLLPLLPGFHRSAGSSSILAHE